MPRGAETVIVRRPAAVDWQGDPVGDPPAPISVEGCLVWPQSTRERNDQGIVVLESMGVWMPSTTPAIPTAEDAVEIRGKTYEVVGAVGHFLKGQRDKGYLFTARRVGT